MRLLFEIDYKNYKENGTIGKRPSARAIIIKNNKLGMIYNKKYDYYDFPGGGIDKNESNEEALIREVKEEVGLEVIKESIKEYGLVIRKEDGRIEDLFIQENYYYLCDVTNNLLKQNLDDYELEEGFSLRWVEAKDVIDTNLNHEHYDEDKIRNLHLMERIIKIINILLDEKLIKM